MEALQPSEAPILCGVDGSDDSLAAARIAVDLGRRLDAPVQMIHVTERPRLSGSRLTEGDYGARLVAKPRRGNAVLLRAANIPQPALDLRVELGGARGALGGYCGARGRPADRQRFERARSSKRH